MPRLAREAMPAEVPKEPPLPTPTAVPATMDGTRQILQYAKDFRGIRQYVREPEKRIYVIHIRSACIFLSVVV